MPVAGVPSYVPRQLMAAASPGLRFGMYVQLWEASRTDWQIRDENKRDAIKNTCGLTAGNRQLMKALVERQQAIACAIPAAAIVSLEGVAVAPFTTGLGNEHPLENGFAFLNPYGHPYLPGSGVKGVVRQAARELASGDWGEAGGWSLEPIYRFKAGKEEIGLSSLDVLFGRKTETGDTGHTRGALTLWDVLPLIDGDLAVEVMTPHQSDYYQGRSSPHDSGSPNPINFLTVPPKSKFIFHVLCDRTHLRRLAPPLAEGENWKKFIDAAFAHAFEWLGFGAKTSVGYGALARTGGETSVLSTGTQSTQQKRAAASGTNEVIWRDAVLSWNAGGGGRLTVSFEKRRAEAVGEAAQKLLQPLSTELVQQIKRRGLKADVKVHIDGNLARAIEITPPGARES
ncbi:MAG TPA: type III-B CRISPR module RAMP protein Cmr6 [Xanthobacteraceae bacterium]|jgi:CRISPR-associated protein Cmr6